MKKTLVPIHEHTWTADYSYMRHVTCLNHPTALYFTKNPFERRLILNRTPDDENIPRTVKGECTCPFAALAVILMDGKDDWE